MFKFLSIAALGIAGLLVTSGTAEAGGRRCCSCPGPAAVAPDAPPAPTTSAPPSDGAQVVRSYSYEPSTTYRSYGRSYRSPIRNEYDAGRKIRGM